MIPPFKFVTDLIVHECMKQLEIMMISCEQFFWREMYAFENRPLYCALCFFLKVQSLVKGTYINFYSVLHNSQKDVLTYTLGSEKENKSQSIFFILLHIAYVSRANVFFPYWSFFLMIFCNICIFFYCIKCFVFISPYLCTIQ